MLNVPYKNEFRFYGLNMFKTRIKQNFIGEIKNLDLSSYKNVITVGCGASGDLAIIAKNYFNKYTDKPSMMFSGFDLLANTPSFVNDETLVIVISHSGRPPELIKAIQKVKDLGAFIININGFEDAELSKVANETILYSDFHWLAPIEIFLELVNMSNPIDEFKSVMSDLKKVPDTMISIFETFKDKAVCLGEKTKDWNFFYQTAIGNLEPLMNKTNVNCLEFLWVHNAKFNASDFPHGAWEVFDENSNLIVYNSIGENRRATENVISFINERPQSNMIVFDAKDFMNDLHEDLQVLVMWLPVQMWLTEFAIQHDHDPMTRRYMDKIDFWKF